MDTGDYVDRAIVRAWMVLLSDLSPDLAKRSLPPTDFGVIAVPSFTPPYAVLLRETDAGTIIEKRESALGPFRPAQPSAPPPNEWPDITTLSAPLQPDIAAATTAAIRRALANARPHRPGNRMMADGATYYFFRRGDAGQAHSPDGDTEAGRLVRLVHVLSAFMDDRAEEDELRAAAETALGSSLGPTSD